MSFVQGSSVQTINNTYVDIHGDQNNTLNIFNLQLFVEHVSTTTQALGNLEDNLNGNLNARSDLTRLSERLLDILLTFANEHRAFGLDATQLRARILSQIERALHLSDQIEPPAVADTGSIASKLSYDAVVDSIGTAADEDCAVSAQRLVYGPLAHSTQSLPISIGGSDWDAQSLSIKSTADVDEWIEAAFSRLVFTPGETEDDNVSIRTTDTFKNLDSVGASFLKRIDQLPYTPLSIQLLGIISFLECRPTLIPMLAHGADALKQSQYRLFKDAQADDVDAGGDDDFAENIIELLCNEDHAALCIERLVKQGLLSWTPCLDDVADVVIPEDILSLIRYRLRKRKEEARYFELAAAIVCASLNTFTQEELLQQWSICEGFASQFERLWSHDQTIPLFLQTCTFTLLRRSISTVRVRVGVDLQRRLLALTEERLGGTHELTLRMKNSLAEIYADSQKMPDAERLFESTLEECEEWLGPKHSLTFLLLMNLASFYDCTDRPAKAKEIFDRAIDREPEVDDEDFMRAPEPMFQMGVLLKSQKHGLDAAEKLIEYVLSLTKANLGENSQMTLLVMGTLAETYSMRERYDEAADMHAQTLAGWESILGNNSTEYSLILQRLAAIHIQRSRTDEALPLLLKALAIEEERETTDHAVLLDILYLLAQIYGLDGQYEPAVICLRRSLPIVMQTYRSEDWKILVIVQTTAHLHYAVCRFDEAEQLCHAALEVFLKDPESVVDELLDLLGIFARIAVSNSREGKEEEARRIALDLYSRPPTEASVVDWIDFDL